MRTVIGMTSVFILWDIILIISIHKEYKKKIIKNKKLHYWFNSIILIAPTSSFFIIYGMFHKYNLLNLAVEILLIIYGLDFICLCIETSYLYLKPAYHKLHIWDVILFAIVFYLILSISGTFFQNVLYMYLSSSLYKDISYISLIGVLCPVVCYMISYCSDYIVYKIINSDSGSVRKIHDKQNVLNLVILFIKCISIIYPILIILFLHKYVNNSVKKYLKTHTTPQIHYFLTLKSLDYDDVMLVLLLVTLVSFGVMLIFVFTFVYNYYSRNSPWTNAKRLYNNIIKKIIKPTYYYLQELEIKILNKLGIEKINFKLNDYFMYDRLITGPTCKDIKKVNDKIFKQKK